MVVVANNLLLEENQNNNNGNKTSNVCVSTSTVAIMGVSRAYGSHYASIQ